MSDAQFSGPIGRLTCNGRYRWARSPWIILVAFILAAAMFRLARLPITSTTPSSIELELPGTADGALAVLRAFQDAGVLAQVVRSILWDFVLILSYSIGLATLLEWLAARDPDHADELVGYFAWGALLAGACDVLENTFMLILLALYPETPPTSPVFALSALLGTLASLAKWTLLTAVVGYASWELAKTLGRAFFSPKPTATDTAPPAPAPSPGEGVAQGVEPTITLAGDFLQVDALREVELAPAPRKTAV